MALRLTNWASRNHHQGRLFSIMACPREWEHGAGIVTALTPDRATFWRYRRGELTLAEYREAWEQQVRLGGFDLTPGKLSAWDPVKGWAPVQEGDTLLCGCSLATAKAGACHRVWAAEALRAAGWNVWLDSEVKELPDAFC